MSSEQEKSKKVYVKRLHRPDDEIAEKPRLIVKPVGSRQESTEAKPGLRAGTLYAAEGEPAPEAPPSAEPVAEAQAEAQAAEPAEQETPRPSGKLPRIEPNRKPLLYATHRPPPKDEKEEQEQLAAITGRQAEQREVSAGFLLGVALIVVVLIGGIMLSRVQKRLRRLEARISLLERGNTVTAEAPAVP